MPCSAKQALAERGFSPERRAIARSGSTLPRAIYHVPHEHCSTCIKMQEITTELSKEKLRGRVDLGQMASNKLCKNGLK